MKQKTGRKLLSFLLTLAMIVGLMPGMGLTAYAADDAKYREYAWNETSKTLSYEDKDIPDGVTELATDTVAWTGWYIVPKEGVTIGNRITVTGTANLILRDGATLTASKGITVNSGNTINIYAQSAGTGNLISGANSMLASIGGGGRGSSSGTVNIHGGKITATGGFAASGIGGALEGGNGEVNIYSGEVTARGKNYAAGIGGYSNKSGGTVNIYGGTVNASGSEYGTTGIGIGGIKPGSCVVHIYGGEVTATSEKAAAGIQGTVTIDGGTVTATGGVSDSISSFREETYSSNGINGTVTVNGGTVTAFGGNVTGSYSAIESNGGTIYACSGISGTVTISGGTVTATGGNVTGDINNNYCGGTICACNGVNGTVTISGGTVTATGGSHTGKINSYSSGTTVKEKGFGGSLTLGDSMKVLGGDNADPTTEIEKSNDDYARFKYMLVKLGHVHSFTYEANDATIKATCSQNDCTLNDGQGNHTAILTIGAPTLNTYGQTGAGISAEATITDADNIKGTATVVYKKGDETLASAPTDAGTYTASITLGTVTASVEYTIARKAVTVSDITASEKIYDGTTEATLVTTGASFAGKLDSDNLTVSATGTFENANVGEGKNVTINGLTLDGTSKENYVLADEGQQTTATANIIAKEVGLTWSNTELTYNGEAQKPTATATGLVDGDTCTVTVTGEQTNVGENYTATAESLSNSNYKLPENKTTAFKITKADAVAATVTANNRTYDGTEKPLVTVAGEATGGEMQYALGENATTAPADNLYTTSIPTETNAGTYYVWYKVVGDADHADSAAAYVTVTIGKAAGGGSGGSSGSTITVPVSGDSASVSVSASVSGATATVKAPTTAQLDKVIGESVKTGEVTIDVSGLNRNIATVSIPTETVKAIEKAVNDPDNDADVLTVKLTDGSVTFDAKALAAVVDQAKGSTIQLNLDNIGESKLKSAQKTAIKDMDVQAVYDAYMTSNGQRISDFKGGKAAVTVSYTLKDGQTGRGVVVWYVADDGKTTEVPTAYNDKTVSFTVEHFSNYVIAYDEARAVVCPQDNTCPISAFSDASATAWYHDGVHYVLESGIMNGVGNGKFGPGNATSRAMIAQILWNMEGKPIVNYAMRYTDVDADAWYAEAVRWATAQGIMSGYGYNKFGPNDDMTREQLVTIMYRYAQYKGVDVSVGEDTNILSYDDALTVSEFAIPAMQWAVGSGAVSGRTNTTLNPKDTATRAEIATIIMRYCEEIAK